MWFHRTRNAETAGLFGGKRTLRLRRVSPWDTKRWARPDDSNPRETCAPAKRWMCHPSDSIGPRQVVERVRSIAAVPRRRATRCGLTITRH